MAIWYSRKENGFFVDGINQTIPGDKVEVTVDVWQHLLTSQGPASQLSADTDGNPILINPQAGNAVVYTSVGQT